jgi:AcrR family transcriptional regulator
MGIGRIPAPVRKVTGVDGLVAEVRPKRGRPRSEVADRAILDAAAEVLATRGLTGLSIEEVAALAGVGKATIYRRWSSKGTLALDAFLAQMKEQLPLPDTGTLRGDLSQALQAWVQSVTRSNAGGTIASLVAEAQRDPELAANWRDRVVTPMRKVYAIAINRAIHRGEIPADTDADIALDLLFGAASYRLLNRHAPLNEQFVQRIADVVMAGLAAT